MVCLPLHNLPTQLTSFIGREREIAAIQRLLRRTRLLTFTGSGGCGKTRLALQIAAGILKRYPDGVWFVDLAPLAESALVPQAVAAAVGVRNHSSRALLDVLRDYLRSRCLLLVVDNCEHVLTACRSLIEMLLKTCPRLHVLATSRERLTLAGETAWRVPSLQVPERETDPAALAEVDSVRLFLERTAALTPTVVLTSENADAIVHICRRLDGMPLAIEIAAARTTVLTPSEIAARLDDQFRLLVGGNRTVPRQETLRAAVDWSYALLSPPEQAVLRRFAVFAGGASLQAAEVVCADDELLASSVLDVLGELANKSLLVVDVQHDVSRYRLLETTRQYALERLHAAGESSGVFRRHADWCEWLAEEVRLREQGPDLPVWLERLEKEHDNVRAALAWPARDPKAASRRARITWALWYFWYLRGHWSEARRWVHAALDERDRLPRSILLPRLFAMASVLERQVGNFAAAMQLANDGVAVERETNDTLARSWLTFAKGLALRDLGKRSEAEAACEETIHLARPLQYMNLVSMAYANWGQCAAQRGDHALGNARCTEALSFARDLGDPYVIAVALYHLGRLANMRSDPRSAAGYYLESLQVSRVVKDWEMPSACIMSLAGVARAYRNYLCAATLLGAADASCMIVGHMPPPVTRRERDHEMAALRRVMGTDPFERAYAEGHAMTLERAVEYALAALGPQASTGAQPLAKPTDGIPLTVRERDVVRLVARGLTNRQIAGTLDVAERTVDTHVEHILNKLGFSSRAQIAGWAVEQDFRAIEEPRFGSHAACSDQDRRPT